MTNYCHLSYEDRKNIEDGLNENKSINQIAIEINRNHSTILREIDRNKVYFEPKHMELTKTIITIEIYHVKDYLNLHMFVMVAILEEVVEKKGLLIMPDMLMILIAN